MKRVPLLIAVCFVLAIGLHYRINQKYNLTSTSFAQLMYLPSGKYLKYAAFGYDNLLADAIYLWSIQYYSDPAFHPHLEYLKHTYDLITELDPAFIDAYQTGALLMFYDGRDAKSGFALLDKGFEKNPNEWIIPVDAGFYAMMNVRNYKLADHYFAQAAQNPEAPSLVSRILAGVRFRRGEKKDAYELWKQIYETAPDASVKQVAYQHYHELKVLIDLETLRNAVKIFHDKAGKNPLRLEQLISAQIISEIPIDPEGESYQYDPQTGHVKYSGNLIIYKPYE